MPAMICVHVKNEIVIVRKCNFSLITKPLDKRDERDTHSHARDAFNVPKSTDADSQLLMDASLDGDFFFGMCVRKRIQFSGRCFPFCHSGWMIVSEQKIQFFSSEISLSHSLSLAYTCTQRIRIDKESAKGTLFKRESHSGEALSEQRERMLIAEHVDFSMRLLSTFRLFSQTPYVLLLGQRMQW